MFSGINEYIVYIPLFLSPDGFTKFSIWIDNFCKSTYVTYRYSTEEYGTICNICMNIHYSGLFKIGSINCCKTLAESLYLVHVYIFDYLNYRRGIYHMVKESLFSVILTWHRRYRDHEGGAPKMRLSHCTQAGLTLAITPNVGNSGA